MNDFIKWKHLKYLSYNPTKLSELMHGAVALRQIYETSEEKLKTCKFVWSTFNVCIYIYISKHMHTHTHA